MSKKLKDARIIGYYSLPSRSLAEHNPTAYMNALASAPQGAGSCWACGRGLTHHVIIKDDSNTTRLIGTDCAQKVGIDSDALRMRLTSVELAELRAKRKTQADISAAERLAEQTAYVRDCMRRIERIADIYERLICWRSSFAQSLAQQLLNYGRLSFRQADYVAKMLCSDTGRRNKKNAADWDLMIDRCTEGDGE